MELFYILTEMEIIYQILNVNKVLQLWRTSDQICNTLKSFSLGLIPQTQTFVMNLKEFRNNFKDLCSNSVVLTLTELIN